MRISSKRLYGDAETAEAILFHMAELWVSVAGVNKNQSKSKT
jgi:hypothetical protein